MKALISIDINGTTEWGDPPGPITVELLHQLQQKGHLLLGGSNHNLEYEAAEFKERNITIQRIVHKVPEWLKAAKHDIEADRYIVVGDGMDDAVAASLAEFEYMNPQQFIEETKKWEL